MLWALLVHMDFSVTHLRQELSILETLLQEATYDTQTLTELLLVPHRQELGEFTDSQSQAVINFHMLLSGFAYHESPLYCQR